MSIPLDDLCVLIGENNSGKSSVLDAIRVCFNSSLVRGARIFSEYDYHLKSSDADPTTSNPIEITLTFAEAEVNEWSDEISRQLEEVELLGDAGMKRVKLRVISKFDSSINDYVTKFDFIDLNDDALLGNFRPHLASLHRLVPVFYLSSLRDAAKEFRAGSKFWGPFVRSINLDESDRKELEKALFEINELILSKHDAFDEVTDRLKETTKLVPLNRENTVSMEAVPTKIFDVLSRTQVNLASKTGAQIPIIRHGSGTQSLAVIFLFDAFVNSKLDKLNGENTEPILVLEEPEANLHPFAVKAIGKSLSNFTGQRLLSTYSGDLLASIPFTKIRRLRGQNGRISVHFIDDLKDFKLTPDDLINLGYHGRASRGGLLFSRCWLFVEGKTEGVFLPECAHALGYDFFSDGISCIEFVQIGLEKLIKLADQLGIEWFVLTDNDSQGRKYRQSAMKQLGGKESFNHIRLLDNENMEVFLCVNGFGEIYESTISPQKQTDVTAERDTLLYWQQVVEAQMRNVKTKNLFAVVKKITEKGPDSVPKLLREVVEQVQKLAQSAI